MSPARLFEQVRAAQVDVFAVDLRGHADDTRRAIHRACVALVEAEDVLRAGDTLARGTLPGWTESRSPR